MAETSADGRPSRRHQRRLQHLDLSRAQLLDAAEEGFGRKGYHATTLKEVADLAEFSVGSVYSFFDHKGDLFSQVLMRRGVEIVGAMQDAVAGGGSCVDQLHRLVDAEVGFFRGHPHFARLFRRSSDLVLPRPGKDVDSPEDDTFHTAMALHADVFRRGQAAGQFRSGDPAVLGSLLSGLVSAYQALDPEILDPEILDPEILDPEIMDDGAREPDAAASSLATLHRIVEDAFRA
jgi:AcrR family transcriptional regulator